VYEKANTEIADLKVKLDASEARLKAQETERSAVAAKNDALNNDILRLQDTIVGKDRELGEIKAEIKRFEAQAESFLEQKKEMLKTQTEMLHNLARQLETEEISVRQGKRLRSE